MISFTTQSGSVYLVDEEKKVICRSLTSDRSGESVRVSGEWRSYHNISDILVGENVLIVWGNEVELLDGSPEYATPTTMTSPVVSSNEVPPPNEMN